MTNSRLNSIALHYIHSDRTAYAAVVAKINMESGHRF